MQFKNIPRKKLMKALIPVLLFPFAAILFFTLGGGDATQTENTSPQGINSHLPAPSAEEGKMDKLSLYKKAAADSAKIKAEEKTGMLDFFTITQKADPTPTSETGAVESPFSAGPSSTDRISYHNSPVLQKNEQQLTALDQKLSRIQRAIDQEPATMPTMPMGPTPDDPAVARLEDMMTSLQQDNSQNAELAQMSGMLQSILDIQHPDRVRQRIKQQSEGNAGMVYPVSTSPAQATSAYFGGLASIADTARPKGHQPHRSRSVFYDDLDKTQDTAVDLHRAIEAVVHQQQTLVSGAWMKIRLQQPVYVDGRFIPAGTFLFGSCELSGDRLNVEISSIRSGNSLYPVSLSVFDLDGNAGIRIDGSINRDVSKQSADQAIQTAAMGSLDPSIGAQAASAGIETARRMLSKKVRLVRVTVNSDYPILLVSKQ